MRHKLSRGSASELSMRDAYLDMRADSGNGRLFGMAKGLTNGAENNSRRLSPGGP